MIKAVVFDVYGTLISTGTGSVEAAQKILDRYGSDISAKAFYADWKKYHRKHMDGLSRFVPEETIFLWDLEKLYEQYGLLGNAAEDVHIMLDTLGNRTAFPESKAVVEQLKRSVKVCIGSTTDTEPLMRDLARSGISVEHIFTSEGLQVYKPQKAFYEKILSALALQTEEVLFVGDSFTDDIHGPRLVGMKTCWVNRKKETPPEVPPDYEVSDLNGLLAFLSDHEKLEAGTMSTRIEKTNYYLDIAEVVAARCTCLRRHYGAVIVKNDEIISTGYVGAPRGRVNCTDVGFCRREKLGIARGQRYELCRSVHAEANAIISASRRDMMDSTLYLVGKEVSTGEYVKDANSCAMCKRMIINAGISRVIIRDDKEHWREIAVSGWVENDDSMTDVLGY